MPFTTFAANAYWVGERKLLALLLCSQASKLPSGEWATWTLPAGMAVDEFGKGGFRFAGGVFAQQLNVGLCLHLIY